MNIGIKIRELRKANEMTLQELGDKVGVGKSTVRKWETGAIGSMKVNNLMALANALGVTVEQFTETDAISETNIPCKSNDVGIRIKNLRVKAGISQVELAEMIGESKQTVYKYEKGIVTNIPKNTVQKLADVLNCTPTYIMGWTPMHSDDVYTAYEKELIQKYRKLDEISKKAVENLIDIELKRNNR